MRIGGAELARSGASNLLDNVKASQMLAAFIVTRQRRSDCIIHFQLESCSNAHNAAADPNTLPSLTSTGSLNPIISSSGIVHHCVVRLLYLLCLSSRPILIIIFIWSNYFLIRLMNEYFDLYEAGELLAASSNTYSSFFKSVSVLFALRLIGLLDFDCGPWQQSAMFSACWDDWCGGRLCSWIFQCQLCERLCEVPSTPKDTAARIRD